jgi:hypothetical protein
MLILGRNDIFSGKGIVIQKDFKNLAAGQQETGGGGLGGGNGKNPGDGGLNCKDTTKRGKEVIFFFWKAFADENLPI